MNKQKMTRITTNIDTSLLLFVDRNAIERQVTRRDIFEESIKRMQSELNHKTLLDGYNRLADDEEYMKDVLLIANNPANL